MSIRSDETAQRDFLSELFVVCVGKRTWLYNVLSDSHLVVIKEICVEKIAFFQTPRRGSPMLAQANGLGHFHHKIISPEGAARNETFAVH